jgi:hypothetical protein
VDNALVTGDQIIGRADLSPLAFEAAMELDRQNKLGRYNAHALAELSDKQISIRKKLENKISELIEKNVKDHTSLAIEFFSDSKFFTDLFREVYNVRESRLKSLLSQMRDLIIAINIISYIQGINENEIKLLKNDLMEICAMKLIKNGINKKKFGTLQLEKILPLEAYTRLEDCWNHYEYYHIFEKIFAQKFNVENDLYQGKWLNTGCIKWQREILWQLSEGRDFYTGQKFTEIYKIKNPDGLSQFEIGSMNEKELEEAAKKYIARHHYRTDLSHSIRTRDCRVSAVVLIWKDYERVIHDRIQINPSFGKTYAFRFENTIKQLLQGNAPTAWLPQYRTEFQNINRNSENTLGILFLFYQQFFLYI